MLNCMRMLLVESVGNNFFLQVVKNYINESFMRLTYTPDYNIVNKNFNNQDSRKPITTKLNPLRPRIKRDTNK